MKSATAIIAALLFCGLVGRVELFKFGKYVAPMPPPQPVNPPPPPPPPPQAEQLYAPLWLAPQQPRLLPAYQPEPLYQEQQQESSGTKGGQRPEPVKGAPLAPLRQQPALLQPQQPLSYLIVRPVQSFGSFLEPQYNYQPQLTRPAYIREESSTKGGQRPVEQQEEQQHVEDQQTKEPIVQQQEHIDEPQPQPQPPPAIVYPIHPAKESKLRAMLEKIKAKFTLGSSYQVVGEEYVQPIPPPQPLPPRPQPVPVEQQQIEEQVPEQQRDLGFQEELPKQQPIQQEPQQLLQQQPIEQQQAIQEEKGSKNTAILIRQEESKAKRQPEKFIQQQQPLALSQEPIRQNEVSKGQLRDNSGF